MNKIIFTGYLGGDPEVRTAPDGNTVASFTVGSQTYKNDANGEKITNWYRCSAWRQLGENAAKYLHKGSHVSIVGNIVFRPYVDKNGAAKLSIDVDVNDLEFLGGKNDSNNAQAPAPAAPAQPPRPVAPAANAGELPF